MTKPRMLLAAALAALAFSAHAQDPAQVAAAAPYLAIESCMKDGKDSQAQTTCVLGVALMQAKATGAVAASGPGAPPAQPIVVQNEHWGVSLAKTVFGGLYGAVRDLGPTAAAIYQARSSKDLGIKQAEYARDTSIATTDGFVRLGTAGVTGTASVGIAGVNAIAARPSTAITVAGNQGDTVIGGGTIDRRNCATITNVTPPTGGAVSAVSPSGAVGTIVPGGTTGPITGGC